MKILLIDDSRIIRNIERRALAELGMTDVAEANDGVEAIMLTQTNPGGFGLVLSDWNMPNMDGLTFVKKFRTQDKTTPVIMVTTEAEKSRVMEAIKAGVNNYVVKPFTVEMLSEKIKQTLATKSGTPRVGTVPAAAASAA